MPLPLPICDVIFYTINKSFNLQPRLYPCRIVSSALVTHPLFAYLAVEGFGVGAEIAFVAHFASVPITSLNGSPFAV